MATRTKGIGNHGSDKPAGKPRSVGTDFNADFRGYVNLQLSPEQKAAFDAWSASAAPWEALEGFVSDGINLSLKIEPKSGGFLASATQRRSASPNAGLVVTARAQDAGKAFLRCLFCLTILSRHERWEDTQPMADPDRW